MKRTIASVFALMLAVSLAPAPASANVAGHPHKCWDGPRHQHWHWC